MVVTAPRAGNALNCLDLKAVELSEKTQYVIAKTLGFVPRPQPTSDQLTVLLSLNLRASQKDPYDINHRVDL